MKYANTYKCNDYIVTVMIGELTACLTYSITDGGCMNTCVRSITIQLLSKGQTRDIMIMTMIIIQRAYILDCTIDSCTSFFMNVHVQPLSLYTKRNLQ